MAPRPFPLEAQARSRSGFPLRCFQSYIPVSLRGAWMRRLRQLFRILLTGAILIPIALGLVAVVARFSDGPIAVFPGGPLVSGVVIEFEAVDWGRVAHLRELEFQLEPPLGRAPSGSPSMRASSTSHVRSARIGTSNGGLASSSRTIASFCASVACSSRPEQNAFRMARPNTEPPERTTS